MSRSAGPGSPVSFRCSRCRSTLNPRDREGYDVELTGRTRAAARRRYSMRGIRSTSIDREYRCRDCGHVGWSNHVDLALRAGVSWEDSRR